MNGLIEINDFMEHLKANNLVIVDRSIITKNVENDLSALQNSVLNRTSANLSQIAKSKLLPIHSKQGLRVWITNGTIKPDEFYKTPAGIIMVMISAVKRLQKLKGLK